MRSKKVLFPGLFLCFFLTAVSAAPRPFAWRAALIKLEAGGEASVPFSRPVDMKDGDCFRFFVEADARCRFYLLYEDSSGAIQPLHVGAIEAGVPFRYPADGSRLTLEPPSGDERFHFILSREGVSSLDSELSRLESGTAGASRAVADQVTSLRRALASGAEAPGKPVPMGGTARGDADFKTYSFSGAASYVKTIRIAH